MVNLTGTGRFSVNRIQKLILYNINKIARKVSVNY